MMNGRSFSSALLPLSYIMEVLYSHLDTLPPQGVWLVVLFPSIQVIHELGVLLTEVFYSPLITLYFKVAALIVLSESRFLSSYVCYSAPYSLFKRCGTRQIESSCHTLFRDLVASSPSNPHLRTLHHAARCISSTSRSG